MSAGHATLDGLIFASEIATFLTFTTVFLQLKNNDSAHGLSLQSLAAVVALRLLHTLSWSLGVHYHPAVLPETPLWYMDIANALAGTGVVAFFLRHYDTYEKAKDNFGFQILDKFHLLRGPGQGFLRQCAGCAFLYTIVAVVALVRYHWKEVPNTTTGCYVSFYEALSALALLPQLWMFQQDPSGRVPSLLANFVVMVAVHKLFILALWVLYPWLVSGPLPLNRGTSILNESLNLLILSDFLYCWVRSKLRGYPDVVLDLEMTSKCQADLSDIPCSLG